MDQLYQQLLGECVRYLSGNDLLGCIYVCSRWYNDLKPCQIPHIWKQVVQNELQNTILKKYLIQDVSKYPVLINLNFGTGCQICGTPKFRKIYFPFLIRCCVGCFENSTIADYKLKDKYKFDLSEFQGLKTFSKSTWNKYHGSGSYKVYWTPSIEARLGYTLRTRLENIEQRYRQAREREIEQAKQIRLRAIDRLLQFPLMIEATKNNPVNQEVIQSLQEWSHDENHHPYEKLAKEYIFRAFSHRVERLHEVLETDEISKKSNAFWDALLQDPFEEKTLDHLRKLIKSRKKRQIQRDEEEIKKKKEAGILLEKEMKEREVNRLKQLEIQSERKKRKQEQGETNFDYKRQCLWTRELDPLEIEIGSNLNSRCPQCPASSKREFHANGLVQHFRAKHAGTLFSSISSTE